MTVLYAVCDTNFPGYFGITLFIDGEAYQIYTMFKPMPRIYYDYGSNDENTINKVYCVVNDSILRVQNNDYYKIDDTVDVSTMTEFEILYTFPERTTKDIKAICSQGKYTLIEEKHSYTFNRKNCESILSANSRFIVHACYGEIIVYDYQTKQTFSLEMEYKNRTPYVYFSKDSKFLYYREADSENRTYTKYNLEKQEEECKFTLIGFKDGNSYRLMNGYFYKDPDDFDYDDHISQE